MVKKESEIYFTLTGFWGLGYLLYVWLTPAQFNLQIFIIPLFLISFIEAMEAVLKILHERAKHGN
jgi:uncharacterized membrane protein YwaF